MKKLTICCAVVLFPALAFAGSCNHFYPAESAPILLNREVKVNMQELCSDEYVVMHSDTTRGPLWSAEHLTKPQLMADLQRVNAFHADDRIAANDRAELADFDRSGYDRGHMAPSGDAGTRQAQFQTFLLSNMVPQNPDNNRHLHERIETAVRNFVKEKGDKFVITGPLFVGPKITQLNGRVAIPTHIFKLVYDQKSNAAAAYLEKNEAGSNYQIISAAELSKISGIDFLPGVGNVGLLDLPRPANENEVDKLATIAFESGVEALDSLNLGSITKDRAGLRQVNQLMNRLAAIKAALEREAGFLPEHIDHVENTVIDNPFDTNGHSDKIGVYFSPVYSSK